MKEFFKYVLATIVGLFLFGIVMFFFAIMTIVSAISSGDQVATIGDNSVMVINLSGVMEERVEDNIFTQLSGQDQLTTGLDATLEAIKKAQFSDKVKGIYIEAGTFGPDSYASMQAIRRALEEFKKSGKWIVAYGDAYTQGTYYISSVADKLYLNPQGIIDWHGLAAQPIFIKDVLAKVGVKMQVAKVGSYKSATEMFTGDKMSDADREQTEAYINGIWQNVTQAVATSRKISVATLNQYADSLITFAAPQDYVKMKMVDQLLYTDQVKKEIKKRLNLKDDEKIKQVTVNDMTKAKGAQTDGDEIAVYYAYGNIVDGVVGDMTSREHVIDAQTVCKDLEELTNDDDVKAVVLRINSGGGSAYASEQIWHQLMELKKKKPVVVSMGGMAASGGYYISAAANWIVAEPTTLTGSIGIFGMFPDMSGLLTEKIGVKFDEVKTNKNSAFGTRARPFTPEEMSILEKYVDRGYKLFRQRVAEGRKMTTDQVEQIAQGHVWIGQDAMKIKLVDDLGGIEKAINKAAALAKIKDFHTQSYPAQTDWITKLMDRMEGSNYLDEQMRVTLGEYYDVFSTMKTMNQQSAIQARIPYYIYVR